MEALVLLIIPVIAIAVYLISRFQSYGVPASPQELEESLRAQLVWHEHRLRHAREKNWDRDMIERITEELHDTRFQLAQHAVARGRPPVH